MIKLGYIKFMDGGIDMGIGAALVAAAVIGAGASACFLAALDCWVAL